MSSVPDGVTLQRNRDLVGRERDPWTRRILLVLLVALLAAGLANVFGQRPQTTEAAAPAADLSVYAPERVRAGLLYMARMTIEARSDLKHATLVLDSGWLEQMSLNTVEPSPIGESSRDGRLALDFGALPAGRRLVVFLDFQVNPTNIGHRSQDVELADGERPLTRTKRSITIFP